MKCDFISDSSHMILAPADLIPRESQISWIVLRKAKNRNCGIYKKNQKLKYLLSRTIFFWEKGKTYKKEKISHPNLSPILIIFNPILNSLICC